ncbi:MAG: hypothetical protein C0616_01385 [Desulfuromonas sp.]|nr:MAG: hypothetical protein C0616_01385 [Desulfuromonas sp.]
MLARESGGTNWPETTEEERGGLPRTEQRAMKQKKISAGMGAATGPTGFWHERVLPILFSWFEKRPGGIRFKLAVVTLALIALVTTSFSVVVIRILDEALWQSLLQRGGSLIIGTTTPAGYSILSGDRLALDNLAAKITVAQEDVVYLAILDSERTVLAHNRLEAAGAQFERQSGRKLAELPDFVVQEVSREGRSVFEFEAPIKFADQQVGTVLVGIDTAPYLAAKSSARTRMFWISLLILGVGLAGALLLATRFTSPIKRLAAGVSRIRTGDYDVRVAVSSRDELAVLTTSFNAMAQTIRAQKEELEGSAHELEEAYISTVRILAASLDARDNYTFGHSERVASLSLGVGRRLGLKDDELKDLEIACFLHDIGKIRIPDLVLNKPGSLDKEEARLVRQHPEHGAEIVGLADSLRKYVPVVLYHHEWYDGNGYPSGLKGDEIPLYAQIVAIADSYDAMTTCRPYRPGRSQEEAVTEIRAFRGRQFAPQLADLFIESLQDEPEGELSFIGGAI